MKEVVRTSWLESREVDTALRFVISGAARDTDAVGFIPRAGVIRHHEAGRLALLLWDQEPAGFALWGGKRDEGKIYQLWVPHDARRHEHGRMLADAVGRFAAYARMRTLRARVAADLPCVGFWRAMGFMPTKIAPGGSRRGRMVVTFEREAISTPREQMRAAQPLEGEPGLPTCPTAHPLLGTRG
jgi:ribosomal protein S18 acetylase RimI-like enzyme